MEEEMTEEIISFLTIKPEDKGYLSNKYKDFVRVCWASREQEGKYSIKELPLTNRGTWNDPSLGFLCVRVRDLDPADQAKYSDKISVVPVTGKDVIQIYKPKKKR